MGKSTIKHKIATLVMPMLLFLNGAGINGLIEPTIASAESVEQSQSSEVSSSSQTIVSEENTLPAEEIVTEETNGNSSEDMTLKTTESSFSEELEKEKDKRVLPNLAPFSPGVGDNPAWTPDLQSIIKFDDAQTNYLGGIALDAAGKVWSWGYNAHGMLGTGEKVGAYAGGMRRLDYFVKNDITIRTIEAGYHTNYAIDTNGVVYAWGGGFEGQMGNGTSGIAGTDNILPVVVSSLTGKNIVKISTGIEAASCTYAMDDQGKVYAWGYADDGRIPDSSGYVTKAVEIPSLSELDIHDFDLGNKHGILLDKQGRVYTWGNDEHGQIGNGPLGSQKYPKEVEFFKDKPVVQVSASYESNLALTADGKAYQWGQIYKTSAPKNITTPEEVQIDISSAGYTPEIASVTAGRVVNYFTDTNGRVWSWGYNTYYSWGTDGPLNDKHNKYVAVATQMPKTLGDGDTQVATNDIKAPVFKGASYVPLAFTYYKKFGQWTSLTDGLHPTIYDKKYSVTDKEPTGSSHDKVYLLDKEGRRLVYVINREPGQRTYQGNYYVAEDSYDGNWAVSLTSDQLPAGVTTTTSVPAIKEEEQGWIGLAVDLETFDFTGNQLNEIPFIKSIDTYQSSTLFLDTAGNLYKTGLDGSGTIAWGWDYSVYEHDTAGNNANYGLYNMYNYEVVFMRGAPRVSPPEVKVSAPKEKNYLSEKKKDTVTLDITIDGANRDEQLNLEVEPELKEAKYVVMPYDVTDPNMAITEPTKEEFLAAYGSGKYETGDYIANHPEWQLVQKVGDDPVKLRDEDLTVSENSVIWVFTETLAYTQPQPQVTRAVYDNFYTDVDVTHKGEEFQNPKQLLYQPTKENVTKLTKDDKPTLMGIPLDINGKVIGTAENPPTFNYDKVKIARFDDEKLPDHILNNVANKEALSEKLRTDMLAKYKAEYEAAGNTWNDDVEKQWNDWVDTWFDAWFEREWLVSFSKSWRWHTPQDEEKTVTLNDLSVLDDPNVTDPKVKPAVTHTFYYEKDKAWYAQVHYLGVNQEGNKIDSFTMASEEVLKGVTYKRLPPDLLAKENLIAIEFKEQPGKPPTAFPIDVSGAQELGANGEAEFTIPESAAENTELTIIYIYMPSYMHVNVRQVILEPNALLREPSYGFFIVNTAKTTDWTDIGSSRNVTANSGRELQDVKFASYKFRKENKYYGLTLGWITPQYYQYEGYIATKENVLHNAADRNPSPEIQLDYNDENSYWVTIYLKPTVTNPGNYSWDEAANKFGTIRPDLGGR